MKNTVLWDVTACGYCTKRRFGGSHSLDHHGGKEKRARTHKLLRNVSYNKSHTVLHPRRRHTFLDVSIEPWAVASKSMPVILCLILSVMDQARHTICMIGTNPDSSVVQLTRTPFILTAPTLCLV
jgi:hypothetical protein